MDRPKYDPETLPLGVLGRPHGLAGEIVLRPYHPGDTPLDSLERVLLESPSGSEEHVVVSWRRAGDAWLVRLAGIEDREAASALTNRQVRVPRTALPELASGEFFVHDLWGCAVRNQQGHSYGTVDGIFWNGAHDVLVVRGEREHLIPVVSQFIISVDTNAREVVVDWDPEI